MSQFVREIARLLNSQTGKQGHLDRQQCSYQIRVNVCGPSKIQDLFCTTGGCDSSHHCALGMKQCMSRLKHKMAACFGYARD